MTEWRWRWGRHSRNVKGKDGQLVEGEKTEKLDSGIRSIVLSPKKKSKTLSPNKRTNNYTQVYVKKNPSSTNKKSISRLQSMDTFNFSNLRSRHTKYSSQMQSSNFVPTLSEAQTDTSKCFKRNQREYGHGLRNIFHNEMISGIDNKPKKLPDISL
mmetsp:Transcript_26823/g.30965  ORF Transcript_26823/g.30965 Transcript_26823/m.30965 type:complete len:156 (+) Transcript_26823:35-502(+)